MNDSMGYYQNERKEMLAFLPDRIEKCIEFGCSTGLFLKSVKEKFNAECWGVDIDLASTEIAGNYIDKVIHGDAMAVIQELPDNYFDCLICNDFLEHLQDPELFLINIRRCMKANSYLVASLPNVRSWSNVIEFLFYKDWEYKDSGILDRTHLRFFTFKSLNRFLTKSNFVIDEIKGTRSSSSKIFALLDLLTFRFIHDMKFMGIAVRAIF